jgi:hypothetical protein
MIMSSPFSGGWRPALIVSFPFLGGGCRVEIDRDLSQKHVGPLALARLYGEFCMVQFRYCMSTSL